MPRLDHQLNFRHFRYFECLINKEKSNNKFQIVTESETETVKKERMKLFLKNELKIQEKAINELLKKYKKVIDDVINLKINDSLLINLLKSESDKVVANNADLIVNLLL